MKKLYAVADVVPEDVDYLTAGKEYEIISEANRRAHRCRAFEFLDDTGARLVAMELDCPHLNGGNWRIIEREEEEPTPSLTDIIDQSAAALAQQVGGDHYKDLAIQPIEYIHKNGIGFAEGSVIKYVTRWRSKNGIEDLRKARHFIDLLIDMEASNHGR